MKKNKNVWFSWVCHLCNILPEYVQYRQEAQFLKMKICNLYK